MLLLLVGQYASSQTLQTWSEDHLLCRGSVETSIKVCENATYVPYFTQFIHAPPTPYHLKIAKAVLSLYDVLLLARKPLALDRQYISTRLPNFDKYLTANNPSLKELNIHPISFGIAEESIQAVVPPKTKAFGRVMPGVESTYFKLTEESQYFLDLQHSLFIVTFKKHGWDCLRHIELLASGALPLFAHIENCPAQAIAAHPKHLYAALMEQLGLVYDVHRQNRVVSRVRQLDFNMSMLDTQLYTATVMATLQYTRNVLTTKAMAQYLVSTMQKYSQGKLSSHLPKSILYLTHENIDYLAQGDFMVDLILHGLIKMYGRDTVIDFPSRDPVYKTLNLFNESEYLAARTKLYGKGFTFAYKLDVLAHDTPLNETLVKENIIGHKYDLVILGSAHRGGNLFYWDLICKHYDRLEVAIIDGGDYGLDKKIVDRYASCAHHIFTREGYNS